MTKVKKTKEVQERKDYHHLGSPEFYGDCSYHKGNMEYMIAFHANGSNTHFLNGDVQMNDTLLLGLSEESFETLLESMIMEAADRMKDKLERYNNYKRAYYTQELEGSEEDFENGPWNSFNK